MPEWKHEISKRLAGLSLSRRAKPRSSKSWLSTSNPLCRVASRRRNQMTKPIAWRWWN